MRAGITFFVSGWILLIFGIAMMIPGLLDYSNESYDSAYGFWLAGGITCFSGLLFVLTFYNKYEKLTVREMYLTTTFVWLCTCIFCALPFFFSSTPFTYTDAFFEAMSGLTTMGASVLTNIDAQPHGLLLWRGMLQWIGGLGIIVIALGILPLLRIGGMQLYSMESSDKSGKSMPKTSQIIGTMMMVYTAMTALCALALYFSGLRIFEAITYTLSTIPTGGFAPRTSSAADLSALTQWILTFFMFIAGMPIFFVYFVYKRDWKHIKNDMQIRTYAFFVLISSILMTIWMMFRFPNMSVFEAFRKMIFSIVSILTSTGFTCDSIESWGSFAVIFFVFLFPIGACSGSTSGGIKIFRFNILYLFSSQYLRHKILPHGVFISKYNGKPLTEEITSGVFVFFGIFLLSFLVSCLLLGLLGLDFMTVVNGTLSSLGNTGIAFGPVIGSNFASLPAAAKWIFSIDMMIGRLEYMAVFVLLSPLAWRKEKKTISTTSY